MTKSGPWVRFFASDWLAGTRGLSAVETGIYITLIAMMYERGGRIENNSPRLSRLCGSSNSSFKAALNTLIHEGKIQVEGDYLVNSRVVEELVYSQEKSSLARDAANTRWGKNSNIINGDIDASAMPAQCDGNAETHANQKPEPIKITSLRDDPAEADEVSKGFDAYNEAAEENGWPTVSKRSPQRRQLLKARIREVGGIDQFRAAIRRAAQSSFLTGRTGRNGDHQNWRPDIDFILKAKNFTRLIEGYYDDRAPTGAAGVAHQSSTDWQSRLAFVQRTGQWPSAIWGDESTIPPEYREQFKSALHRPAA